MISITDTPTKIIISLIGVIQNMICSNELKIILRDITEIKYLLKYIVSEDKEIIIKVLGCIQGLIIDIEFKLLFSKDLTIIKSIINIIMKQLDNEVLTKALAVLDSLVDKDSIILVEFPKLVGDLVHKLKILSNDTSD